MPRVQASVRQNGIKPGLHMFVIVAPSVVHDFVCFARERWPQVGIVRVLGNHAGQGPCEPIQHAIEFGA